MATEEIWPPLSTASKDRAECRACALFSACRSPFSRPFVPKGWRGKLLCVGEMLDEDGDARRLLREILREVGYSSFDVAFVDAIRCRPKNNVVPTMKQIRACRPFLMRVVSKLRAQRVVALGTVALKALSDNGTARISASRGRKHSTPEGIEFEVTYHPASILHGSTQNRSLIRSDLRTDRPALPPPSRENERLGSKVSIDTEWDAEGKFLMASFSDGRRVHVENEPNPENYVFIEVVRGHNVWPDIEMLMKQGFAFSPEVFDGSSTRDSLILARMVDENMESYKLEDVTARYFDVGEGWKRATERDLKRLKDAGQLDPELLATRCAWDSQAAWYLVERLEPRIKTELVDYVHRLAATLRRVGLAGIPLHLPTFDRLRHDWERQKAEAETRLRSLGFEGSPTNDNDVRRFLYEKLKFEPISRTEKTGAPAVDRNTLLYLKEKAAGKKAEVLDALLSYAKFEKLASTWGPVSDRITDRRGDVGLFHAWINPVGARTGRRSSGSTEENLSARNAQNWPPQAKEAFVGLVAADFDRLEPVLMAHHSGDKKLLEFFTTPGVNGYVEVARLLFGKKIDEGTTLYRATKSIVLGINYDMGESKTARQLWGAGIRFSNDYAEHARITARIHRRYLKLFYGVAEFIDSQKREVRRKQRVVARDGWIRHLPHDEQTRWRAENQAVNFPIQHAASVVTGTVLIEFERQQLSRFGWSARDLHRALLEDPWNIPFGLVVNEIHDELVLNPKSEEDVEVLISCMREPTQAKRLLKLPDLRLEVKTKRSGHFAR